MLKTKKLLIGILISILLTIGLLILFSAVVVKMGTLPGASASGTMAMASGALANLAAAILTARWAGERGLLHGTILSAVYSVLFIVLSFVLCGDTAPAIPVIRVIIFLLSGALGGIIGVSRKSKVQF